MAGVSEVNIETHPIDQTAFSDAEQDCISDMAQAATMDIVKEIVGSGGGLNPKDAVNIIATSLAFAFRIGQTSAVHDLTFDEAYKQYVGDKDEQ